MKIILELGIVLFSLSAFASTMPLLLDASCKVKCLVSAEETVNDQGPLSYERHYEKTYVDFSALSREQIEAKNKSVELDLLCKKEFSEKSISAGSECLYFKH